MLNNLVVPGSSPKQVLNKRHELSSGLMLMIAPVIIFLVPHGAVYIYSPGSSLVNSISPIEDTEQTFGRKRIIVRHGKGSV